MKNLDITLDPIDDVLLRDPQTYSDEDKALIVANKDQLNEDEKSKLDSILNPKEEAASEDEPSKPDVKADDNTSEKSGITKQELDSYLDDKKKQWDAANVSKADQKEAEKQIIQFYKDGELPKDWNDAGTRIAQTTINQLLNNPDLLVKNLAPRLMQEMKNIETTATENQKRQIQTENKAFDQQMDDLVKSGKIPVKDPKNYKKDPEYLKADESITRFAIEMNDKGIPITSMKQAYELWSKIPTTQGGGLDIGRVRMKAQKHAASMVGSSTGSSGRSGKSSVAYNKLHSTSLDNLIDQY